MTALVNVLLFVAAAWVGAYAHRPYRQIAWVATGASAIDALVDLPGFVAHGQIFPVLGELACLALPMWLYGINKQQREEEADDGTFA